MVSIETCKKYLEKKNLTDKRIEEIRDYLYAISKEVIKNNIDNYELSLSKTKDYGKTQTKTNQ